MLQTSRPTSYSAVVQLTMECDGAVIRLAQVGPEFVVAKTPIELPPCEATLIMVVDGREVRNRVRLPSGMSPSIIDTPIEIIKT